MRKVKEIKLFQGMPILYAACPNDILGQRRMLTSINGLLIELKSIQTTPIFIHHAEWAGLPFSVRG